jgi:cytochrome c-type biogenesis protein CcmH
MSRRGVLALLLAMVGFMAITGPAASTAAPTEREIDAVARDLRCVVCQNLSVADSPSEMARQMRDLVRERLAAGETPAAVKAYFVARYGEWVLLSPPARGFGLLAWGLPLGAVAAGLVIAVVLLRRWSGGGVRIQDDEVDEEALAAVREALKERR